MCAEEGREDTAPSKSPGSWEPLNPYPLSTNSRSFSFSPRGLHVWSNESSDDAYSSSIVKIGAAGSRRSRDFAGLGSVGDDGMRDCECRWPFRGVPPTLGIGVLLFWAGFEKLKNGTVGVRSIDVVGVCRDCGLKGLEPMLEYVAVSELSE